MNLLIKITGCFCYENKMRPKLFIVVNVGWFFLSHRKEIALAAMRAVMM